MTTYQLALQYSGFDLACVDKLRTVGGQCLPIQASFDYTCILLVVYKAVIQSTGRQ